MSDDLTPEQLARLACLDAVHRIMLGDENVDVEGLIDMARYVETGERPPWPPAYYPELDDYPDMERSRSDVLDGIVRAAEDDELYREAAGSMPNRVKADEAEQE